MMSLAGDITSQKRIFDAPLIRKTTVGYLVFDGNRRVACLKALAGLCAVPERYAKEFEALRADFSPPADYKVSCQVENAEDVVDQIVSRRHNGTDGGKGQLQWDLRAKANHANRVGGTNQYPIAEAVENFLDRRGYPHAKDIARSTLYRLINAKKRQKRFGVRLSETGELEFLRDEEEVLRAFSRVADDILEKNLTLKNVLNSEGVNDYMSTLDDAGLLGCDDAEGDGSDASQKEEEEAKKDEVRQKHSKLSSRRNRNTLIPKVDYQLSWGEGLRKIEMVWQELQFVLRFGRNDISIPILFRTLVELTTDYAVSRKSLRCGGKALPARIRDVCRALEADGRLDKREVGDLERLLGQSRSPVELDALNRAVHSNSALLAESDLIKLWTGFEKYLLLCLRL